MPRTIFLRRRRFGVLRFLGIMLGITAAGSAFYVALMRAAGPVEPMPLPSVLPYKSAAPMTPHPTIAPTPAPAPKTVALPVRGVSIGNALDAPSEGDWGVVVEDADFTLLKNAGFTCVRLPVDFDSHTGDAPSHTLDPALLARLSHLARAGADAGVTVIVSYHSYVPLSSEASRARYSAVWRQLAEAAALWPSTVWLETHHSPTGVTPEQWNSLLAGVFSDVRARNPERPLIACGVDGKISSLNELSLPDDPNLLGGFSYFTPRAYTHQGEPWSSDTRYLRDIAWADTPDSAAAVSRDMESARAWSEKSGHPAIITEFGATARAPSRDAWAGAVARAASQSGVSYCYWDYAGGFGLYSRKTSSFDTPLLSALTP